MRRDIGVILVLAVSLAALPGCKKSQEPAPSRSEASSAPATMAQPVAVVGLTLGNQVGPDKKVTGETKTFAPGDTIYVSVDTRGAAPSAALAARWTYQDGQTVHEETQALALTGPATTEFHVAKPDGWPKGTYKVEILLDGVPVQSANFTVG